VEPSAVEAGADPFIWANVSRGGLRRWLSAHIRKLEKHKEDVRTGALPRIFIEAIETSRVQIVRRKAVRVVNSLLLAVAAVARGSAAGITDGDVEITMPPTETIAASFGSLAVGTRVFTLSADERPSRMSLWVFLTIPLTNL
jgi:hypothetical protein